MPAYHFAVRESAASVDNLGCVMLSDDAEALEFGGRCVFEAVNDSDADFDSWVLIITEQGRPVATIPYRGEPAT